jgi:signal transduction histidine kinase
MDRNPERPARVPWLSPVARWFRERNRLGRRLLVSIMLFSAIVSLLGTLVQLATDYRRDIQTLEEQLEGIRSSYAQSLAASLWSLDEAQLQIQLEGITTLRGITNARVDSALDTTYVAGVSPGSSEWVLTRSFPLTHGGLYLGTLRVSATQEELLAHLRSRVLVILATQVAKTLLVALFVLFIFQRLVTQHLATMAAYTRGLDAEHLDSPLVLHRQTPRGAGSDELDEVSSAINEMRESLRQELGERQRVEMASAFLAEAGEVLMESLDLERVLPRVASLCVGSLADWCIIDLEEDGELRRVGGAHVDTTKVPLLGELQRRYPPGPGTRSLVAEVVLSGRPRLEPRLSEAGLRALCVDDEHFRLTSALGIQSLMVVPLRARGQALGAISFVSAKPERYGPAELSLALELARRAAIAIDNARLYWRADQAIRLRETFLSVAAHELRTPLLPLQLRLQSLLRRSRCGSPVELSTLLDEVAAAERQTVRLGQLVDELLDVSNISVGNPLELRRERVDLCAVVAGVLHGMTRQWEASGSEVNQELQAPALGSWDPRRLEQVVTALLRNALKFGQGRPIDVSVKPRDGSVLLVVRDQGIGMSEHDKDHVFDRFSRGVSEQHYGGLGLGLYIARQLVEAHGGTISVESRPGEGSTFTVVLPVEKPSGQDA